MTVVIVDYGMGNVASVQKALRFLNIDSVISNDPAQIRRASHIVLPGVGSFGQGMRHLKDSGLAALLTQEVVHGKKPFLGICLGMQLLATVGTEGGECAGLGWIPGQVRLIVPPDAHLRVPHLGWNTVKVRNGSAVLLPTAADYYFIHSYHFSVDRPEDVAATVEYGDTLVAALERDNIFAAQFHPEKSQEAGLELLRRFFEKCTPVEVAQ
jgi:glutamine amidotransferase